MTELAPLESLNQFRRMYAEDQEASKWLRLGQYFCNLFHKESWPELYYEADDTVACAMIREWLERHQYIDKLPEPLPCVQLPH
jgi:hypothetical protein